MNDNDQEQPQPQISNDFFHGNIQSGIERMRMRLLDLTNRNRLLNFRHTKRSTLQLVDDSAESVYDRLSEGIELFFKPVPRPEHNRRGISAREYAEQLGIRTAVDLPERSETDHADHRSTRGVQTVHFPEDLESVLRSISGAARLSIDETGVNMLYVIFGFLEWFESDDAERSSLAPLVLLPATLRRGDPDPQTRTYRYFIQYSGEDIVGNVSLQERLKRDFSLDLPDFDEETELADYFDRLKPLLRGYSRWAIRRRMTIGLVSFQKLLMYRDLDSKSWPAGGGPLHHPRVREFFEGVPRDSFDLAPDYTLDDDEKHGTVPQVIYDADSSQHSALVDAIAGKNLVVQGPPGTGKSQTITNLIAAAIANGKNVLFVAEKLAALEVVKRRLDEAGLGAFCLELHSHKAKKKDALENIAARTQEKFPDVRGLDEKLQQLTREKDALNEYVGTINRPCGRSGYTIYEALWAFHRRRSLFAAHMPLLGSMRLASAPTLTAADVADLRHTLSVFGEVLTDIESRWGSVGHHPWNGINTSSLTYDSEQDIIWALEASEQATRELQMLAQQLPFTSVSFATAESVTAQADAIERLRRPQGAFHPATLGALAQKRDALLVFVKKLEEYHKALERLQASLANVSTLDISRLAELRDAQRFLNEEIAPQQRLSTVRESYKALLEFLIDVAAARERHRELCRELDIDVPFTAESLQALAVGVELLQQAPIDALTFRHRALLEAGATTMIEVAQREAAGLRDLRTSLSNSLTLSLAPALNATREHADAVTNAGLFRLFNAKYRAARQAFATMSKSGIRPGKALLGRIYGDLLTYLAGVEEFAANTRYRHFGGPHFIGIDTKWELLWALVVWKQRIDTEMSPFGATGTTIASALWKAPTERLKAAASLERIGVSTIHSVFRIAAAFRSTSGMNLNSPLEDVASRITALVNELETTLAALDTLGFLPTLTGLELFRLIDELVGLANLRHDLDTSEELKQLLGAAFGGCHMSPGALRETLAVYDSVASSSLADGTKEWLLSATFQQRLSLLAEWAAQIRSSILAWRSKFDAFASLTAARLRAWLRLGTECLLEDVNLDDLRARAAEALAAPNELQQWAAYVHAHGEAARHGLNALLEGTESGRLPRTELLQALDLIYLQSLAHAALSEFPILARFNGLSHEQARKRFAQLDAEAMELYRARVAYLASRRPIPAGRSIGPVSTYTEAGLLANEIQKQRRHIPLRQLVARSPRTLQALKPCFMMSPLSVAQYLPSGAISFDLVVMDEASQLKPEDAFGAVLRGTQLVVVGDPMQLPPTTFFDRLDDDEGDEEMDESAAAISDSESILDVAAMLYTPARLLKWHYRSQHGSLIAFSNADFYHGKLVVFPSPVAKSPDLGVQFVHVSGAVYDRGTNSEEARRVVDSVRRHMRSRPGESLGVVALNLRQRELIEEEFEKQLKDDPFAQRFVEGHATSAEPFFIKNLENVQGDERDVIFISITYGPDQQGNVYQRFGPITGRHGHRRLNVLFTRAKRRVVVFSSLTADQVVPAPGSSWGLRALKGYLAYAQSGTLTETRFSGRDPDSDFELEVAHAIRESGFDVVAQLGVTGFYLDLAIKHPDRPDAFLLGVECDGATYHTARTARDRDRLRQQILERLGWRIHRIWSTDWFRNRDAVLTRLKTRIHEALREDAERSRRDAVRKQADVDHPAEAGRTSQQLPKAPPAEPRITRDEARRLLIDLREKTIQRGFPDADRAQGLLRRGLLEILLDELPSNKDEWTACIPADEREDTDRRQMRYLDDVLRILRRVAR